MDDHAQWEIRQYANIIGNEIVANWVPLTWEAFLDYRLNATHLTAIDKKVIKRLNNDKGESAESYLRDKGLIKNGKKGFIRNRERTEMEVKLRDLGYSIPWFPPK